jgi:hypothetical protein
VKKPFFQSLTKSGVFTVGDVRRQYYIGDMYGKSTLTSLHPFRLAMYPALLLLLAGCANGIVGKNTNKNIQALNGTVNKTVTTVSDLITKSRGDILDYLKDSTRSTSRGIFMGILEGTIGYLDDPTNRKQLMHFIDDLIAHAVEPAREQLIEFKDSLLDHRFVGQLSGLAHNLMHELLVQPSTDLLHLVLDKRTRDGLDALLRIPIPAILNDSAIIQIGKLRDTLLGPGMRNDLAGLADATLWVINKRLDTPLHQTIVSIVEDSAKKGRRQADQILYLVIGGVILVSLIIFAFQRYLLYKRGQVLFYVTNEIEKFRTTAGEADFQKLTGQIRKTMLDKRLEGNLRQFLYKEGINKTP